MTDNCILLLNIFCIIVAYLLGSICTGYYLVRLKKGIDIRDKHSGGVGARNVGRELGRYGFIITFVGDAAKGIAAIVLARHFCSSSIIISCVFIAVLSGHIWPLFLNFRGGRGAATVIGAYCIYAPILLGIFFCITAVLVLVKRGVVNSALIAFALLPFSALAMRLSWDIVSAVLCSSIIILIAHKKYLK